MNLTRFFRQCFILLLRPLFLRELSSSSLKGAHKQLHSEEEPIQASAQDGVISWEFECLQAARYNAKILTDLSRIGKIGKDCSFMSIFTRVFELIV